MSDYLPQLFPGFTPVGRNKTPWWTSLFAFNWVYFLRGEKDYRVSQGPHTLWSTLDPRLYSSEEYRCSYIVKLFGAVKSGERRKHISAVNQYIHFSIQTFKLELNLSRRLVNGKENYLLLGQQEKYIGDPNPVPHWQFTTLEETLSQLKLIGSPGREASGSCRLNPFKSTSDLFWGMLARQHDEKLGGVLPAL